MTSIQLKKCNRDEIEVLQEQIEAFIQQRTETQISKGKGNFDFLCQLYFDRYFETIMLKASQQNRVEF